MASAPASMMRPLKTDLGTRIITVKHNLNEHKFKESLEIITLPNKPKEQPKLETEV